MTISRISIRNFQSIQSLDLDLAPFTVVVGPSNSGKSAVRRALLAAATNAPSAGRLRSGASEMSVSVVVDDQEQPITWTKGKKVNRYEVGGVVQDKPGSTITPEAKAALGLGDLNIAGQFDPPYLLAETPGTVAKELGALTNISVLFDGIREATRRKRSASAEAKTLDGQHDRVVSDLSAYADLPAEAERLQAAAALMETAAQADAQMRTFADLVSRAHSAATAASEAERVLGGLPDTTEAERALGYAEQILHFVPQVEQLLSSARSLRVLQEQSEAALRSTENVLSHEPLVLDAERAAQDAKALLTVYADAARLAEAERVATDAAAESVRQVDLLESELSGIDTCPLCGSPMHEGVAA